MKLASASCRWWVPAIIVGLSVTGCSLVRPAPPHFETVAPPPAQQIPTPTATHRFEIDANTEIVGYLQRTAVGKDDTLSDIARRFDVGYEELVLANPSIDPWLPGAGREVLIPTQFVLPAAPHTGLVANVATMRIFYYPPHKKGEPQVVYTFPLGTGRVGWKTREGITKVIERTKDPVWTVPESIRAEHAKDGKKLPARVPAGPDNPLGKYRLRLGWSSYLIHGTNRPAGVGMRVSHGCMQMYPEDIEFLFNQIPVGTQVTIVNQPYLFGWRDGTLYVQAYSVMEDDSRDWKQNLQPLLGPHLSQAARKELAARNEKIDWPRVSAVAESPRALPVAVTGAANGLEGALSTALLVDNVLPSGSNWDGKTELMIDQKTYNELVNGAPVSTPTPEPVTGTQ